MPIGAHLRLPYTVEMYGKSVMKGQRVLAAHLEAAKAIGLDDDEIAMARQGTSSQPAVAALVRFGVQVLRAPDKISDEEVAELRRHGYRDREIAEVVGVVALNLLTGAFNLVAGIEPSTESST